ncbi:MAG: type I DNA topoisomerase [Spirochaetes bacterium]|nr:type I DNA topoisomerase [Spirochaetota bacterium]
MEKKKKILIIVESPAKARTIHKYLGKDFMVESSQGHLIDLPKSRLAIDIEHDFKPEYIVIRGKNDVLKKLKEKARQAQRIYLATDPDREGEAISWHIANVLKEINPDVKRITFFEITRNAVEESLKHPRDINMDRVNAQQARRVLDRLVGYNLSPVLWKKVKSGLSAGRVQSVALKILCQREEEIKNFVPQEYWTIEVEFIKDKIPFKAKLIKINGEKSEIKDEKEADQIKDLLKGSRFIIKSILKKEKRKYPPPPYITSTLQQDGLNKLNFSARKTMRIAQNLYEGVDLEEGRVGLITYMRTDSVRVSNAALDMVRQYIADNFPQNYLPQIPHSYRSKASAQEAHEAIRPTAVSRTPVSINKSLDRDQQRLYTLIFNRFVASQMTPAVLLMTTVVIQGQHPSGTHFDLQLNLSKYLFDGFLRVLGAGKEEDTVLPELKENETININSILSQQHFTNPLPRFTDASLVKVLEESGIGRPATYAPILATLENRFYIVRDGRQLVPTELGMIVNRLLGTNFSDVINEKFTAEMEEKLDRIARSDLDWVLMLHTFYPGFKQNVEKALNSIEAIDDFKKGEPTEEICEKCGSPMLKKLGRFGYFLACEKWPDCKHTRSVPLAGCPRPGCTGKIIMKKIKGKRKFYGCTNYPDCDFIVWEKPLKEECPRCHYFMVYGKKEKKKIKRCSNKECDYFEEVKEAVNVE